MLDIYKLKDTWTDYDPENQIEDKANRIIQMIPIDVKNILDVGCGNGIITNKLARNWDVTGLDSSEEALKYLNCISVLASATNIPFEDNTFDLVLSSEMLEHLNNDELEKAIAEIKRTSAKYILISVPNNETLSASLIRCPICLHEFHAWHHLQSFSENRLTNIFCDEFTLMKSYTTGPMQKNWIPLLLKLKQHLGQWFDRGGDTICPICNNLDFPKPTKNILTKIINGLNRNLSNSRPYWQIQLFKKN